VPGQRCAPKRWIWPVCSRIRWSSPWAGHPRTAHALVHVLMRKTWGAFGVGITAIRRQPRDRPRRRHSTAQPYPGRFPSESHSPEENGRCGGDRCSRKSRRMARGVRSRQGKNAAGATARPSVDGADHVRDARPGSSATLGARVGIRPLPGDDGPYGRIRIGASEGRMDEDTRLPLDRGPLSGGHASVLRRAP
jgi:hypothetical protein